MLASRRSDCLYYCLFYLKKNVIYAFWKLADYFILFWITTERLESDFSIGMIPSSICIVERAVPAWRYICREIVFEEIYISAPRTLERLICQEYCIRQGPFNILDKILINLPKYEKALLLSRIKTVPQY